MVFDAKKYREEHREKNRAYQKTYYLENRQVFLDRSKNYRESHPYIFKEEWKVAKRAWAERNKERRYAEYKDYRKANILRMRARDQRRIARERGAKGNLTAELLKSIYDENIKFYGKLTCYLCLTPIQHYGHLEHKTPLCRGGSNEPDNLEIACKACNLRKRDKTLEEYKRYLEVINAVPVSAVSD